MIAKTQKTLREPVHLSSIGLHSGENVNVVITPAPVNTGILFKVDNKYLPATVDYVSDVVLAVTLSKGSTKLSTVEHFLSAFYALGISNLVVDIDNKEAPIFDGSSDLIVNALINAGIEEQYVNIPVFDVQNPIWSRKDDKFIIILPYDGLRISYSIEYNHPHLPTQTCNVNMTAENYIHKIAAARTYGFYEEFEQLKDMGFARGGSLENALVYSQDGVMNDDLRFENECVRHKVLDITGDLALLGLPIKGHVIAHKAGHALDVDIVNRLREQISLDQFSSNARECRQYLDFIQSNTDFCQQQK